MMNVVAIVHLLFCISLIALVLLQDPKSSGGGMFGGSGGGANTLLGATGAASFLEKLTRYSAVFFGVTCMILTLMSRPEQGSVLDSTPAKASTNTPVNAAGPAGPLTAASPAPAGTTGPGATGPSATTPAPTGAAVPNAPANGAVSAPVQAPAAAGSPAK